VTVLCIIPGPTQLVKTEPDDRPTRWCFTCRKHVPHTWHLYSDPEPSRYWYLADEEGLDGYAAAAIQPIVMPSYYDPVWSLRCPQDHADTYFPGCEPL
jgi:hypothetical protein